MIRILLGMVILAGLMAGEGETTKMELKTEQMAKPQKEVNVDFSVPIGPMDIKAIQERAKNFEMTAATKDEVYIMETSLGTMKIKLYPDVAPKHADNFKRLSLSGYYDGTLFHRVIPGFMIQGGDILSRDDNRGNDGTGGPGWNVPAEFNKIPHEKGILSMARSKDPNSAGSQFFVCGARAQHLDNNYTVFGTVFENQDVIDKIISVPRDSRDNPLEPVRILSIKLEDPGKKAK